MWQVRIELTTLGLWDLRAASCATATLEFSPMSKSVSQTHGPTCTCRELHTYAYGPSHTLSRLRRREFRTTGVCEFAPCLVIDAARPCSS